VTAKDQTPAENLARIPKVNRSADSQSASNPAGGAMTEKLKSTHTQPGGLEEKNPPVDDGMVNDSFGTVNIADSTGLDETKETGDAKRLNKQTHED
jgi:hypothetical protein